MQTLNITNDKYNAKLSKMTKRLWTADRVLEAVFERDDDDHDSEEPVMDNDLELDDEDVDLHQTLHLCAHLHRPLKYHHQCLQFDLYP